MEENRKDPNNNTPPEGERSKSSVGPAVVIALALVLLFGNTQYLTDLMAGRNVIVFICTFVGVNAVLEMLAATAVTGALCATLEKARLIGR